MNKQMYELTRRAEDRLWWYYGMRRISEAFLERYVARDPHQRILDAGCGTGGSTVWLGEWGQVTGLDLSDLALAYSRQRGLPRLVQSSVSALPFSNSAFHLVVNFDVLGHEWVDDAWALAEFARVLRPGGAVLLRVAAYERLKAPHEAAALNRRRYTRHELAEKMKAAGLEVTASTYVNSFLFPVAAVRRWLQATSPSASPDDYANDFWIPPAPLNVALGWLLALEAPLACRTGLPVGLSVVVAGRKP